jgi:hypothetical protein
VIDTGFTGRAKPQTGPEVGGILRGAVSDAACGDVDGALVMDVAAAFNGHVRNDAARWHFSLHVRV